MHSSFAQPLPLCLLRRLAAVGAIFEDSQPRLARPEEAAAQRSVRQSSINKRTESDEDSDFE